MKSGDLFDSYSAGTEEYSEVKPLTVEAMEEIGIPMGCEAKCSFVPSKLEEDWGLDDPSGGTIKDFRKTRNLIEEKIKEFIKRIENNEI